MKRRDRLKLRIRKEQYYRDNIRVTESNPGLKVGNSETDFILEDIPSPVASKNTNSQHNALSVPVLHQHVSAPVLEAVIKPKPKPRNIQLVILAYSLGIIGV